MKFGEVDKVFESFPSHKDVEEREGSQEYVEMLRNIPHRLDVVAAKSAGLLEDYFETYGYKRKRRRRVYFSLIYNDYYFNTHLVIIIQ